MLCALPNRTGPAAVSNMSKVLRALLRLQMTRKRLKFDPRRCFRLYEDASISGDYSLAELGHFRPAVAAAPDAGDNDGRLERLVHLIDE